MGSFADAVDKFREAERAQMSISAPQNDIERRMAWALLAQNQYSDAELHAQIAVKGDPSVLNQTALVSAKVGVAGETGPALGDVNGSLRSEISDLYQRAVSERTGPDELEAIASVGVHYGFLMDQTAMISDFSKLAVAANPNSLEGHMGLAVEANNLGDKAEEAIQISKLKSLGLTSSAINNLINPGSTSSEGWGFWSFLAKFLVFAVGTITTVICGFWLLGMLVSRRSLRWLASTDPNAPIPSGEPFRRPYRLLVQLSGLVYAIVLPLVALVAMVPGLLLSSLMLAGGHVSVKLIQGEFRGIFAVVEHPFKRLGSRLRAKKNETIPGKQIDSARNPRLFALVNDFSAAVGTAPPTRIQMLPDTGFSVYQTASGERVLNLGAGSLLGMDATAFAAIVCHELGHFRGGDTSACQTGRRVTNNIITLQRNLNSGIVSLVLLKSLRLIWSVHQRVTLGANRIQETLADRCAAQVYGAEAFERGLRHVYRREIEFSRTVEFAIRSARRIAETHFRTKPDPSSWPSSYDDSLVSYSPSEIERRVEAQLVKPTSPFDTHPNARERFDQVRLVTSAGRIEPGMAFDLFEDPSALLAEQDIVLYRINHIGSSVFEGLPSGFYQQILQRSEVSTPSLASKSS